MTSTAECKLRCSLYEGLCLAMSYDKRSGMCNLIEGCSATPRETASSQSAVRKHLYTELTDILGDMHCDVGGKVVDVIDNKSDSMDECMKECDRMDSCVAITLNKENERCYLLGDCSYITTQDSPMASAVKESYYTTYADAFCDFYPRPDLTPIDRYENGITTMSQCQILCDADPSCRAANFDASTNECMMAASCKSIFTGYTDLRTIVKRSPYQIEKDLVCSSYDTLAEFLLRSSTDIVDRCLVICDRYKECAGIITSNNVNVGDLVACTLLNAPCDTGAPKKGAVTATRSKIMFYP